MNDPNNNNNDFDNDDSSVTTTPSKNSGRKKIKIEYIQDKNRRHITFSKRKAGIMKKVYIYKKKCVRRYVGVGRWEKSHARYTQKVFTFLFFILLFLKLQDKFIIMSY